MQTLSSNLPQFFSYAEKGIAYALRAVVLPEDFQLLYKWMLYVKFDLIIQ